MSLLRLRLRARSVRSSASQLCSRTLSTIHRPNALLDIHPEVAHALAARKPVVALETALVTNGVPPPTNLAIGLKLEEIVRAQGAVPATIGIVGGRIKVGLERAELERLADVGKDKQRKVKISRRDIGPALTFKEDGGTTICSTLIFAALAGIKVIATGGLGGVHRGAQETMDISADLHELTRCPVGVVSCGVKSILDIGRTLEYLETLGVPVVTYGDSYNFPAFFCGESDFETSWRVNDPLSAARILYTQSNLGMKNGTLFAAPMPKEFSAQGAVIKAAVDQAIRESEENGMSKRGKEVTPWLLARVVELTKGTSLQNNLALLENTAVIGGQIAVELAKMEEGEESISGRDVGVSSFKKAAPIPTKVSLSEGESSGPASSSKNLPSPKLVVIGASAIDITARVSDDQVGKQVQVLQTTAPGSVTLTVGGVARNIAEAAHRFLSFTGSGSETMLLSPIGDDEFAPFLLEEMERLGMRTDGMYKDPTGSRTAVCNMVLDSSGALVGGVADMDIVSSTKEAELVDRLNKSRPSLVVLDANMSSSTITAIVKASNRLEIPTFFEPTSVSKSTAILPAILDYLTTSQDTTSRSPITFASPNVIELQQLYREANGGQFDLLSHPHWWNIIDGFGLGSEWRMDVEQLARQPASSPASSEKGSLSFLVQDGVVQMAVNLLPFFQHLIVKCGERGLIVAMRIPKIDITTPFHARSNPHARVIVSNASNAKDVVLLKHFPAILTKPEEIVSVTGAGDSLVGALSASIAKDSKIFQDPVKLDAAIQLSQEAAVASLHSIRAVSPLLGRMA